MEDTLKAQLKCPIAIKWTIPEYRLQELKDRPGKWLKSDVFNASNISGIEYYASVYPDREKEERRGEAWIYLCFNSALLVKTDLKVDSIFNIKIPSANFFQEVKYNHKSSRGRGAKCCTTEELFDPENLFIVNGKMTIEIEGTLMVEKEIPMKPDLCGGPADLLCLDLWKQENKDFTLLVDGKEITAHKCILAARSPVFARMFETDMKESKENKASIKDFPFNIVEAAIKLCYHHSLVPALSMEDKMKLLQFFDKYDAHALKVELEEHLISEMDASNVCLLTNASLISNAQTLKEKCAEFLRECLQNAEAVSDFDILDADFAKNLFKYAFFKLS